MTGPSDKDEASKSLEYRQLLSIFESIDEPIYVSDPDTGEVLYVNEALRRDFGDVTGFKCFEVFQGESDICKDCPNHEIFGENVGNAHHRESYQPRNKRWYRGISRAIRWPDGRMVRYEMGVDITDQKLAEAALEASEKKYRSLVENVPDIIYALDPEGRLTSINEGGLELLGYSPSDLLGRHFIGFIHPDDQDLALGAFRRALSRGRQGPRGLVFRVVKRNGEALWVSLNSNMTFDEKGRFLEEHGVARDITVRKLAEEDRERFEAQLRQAQKLESLGVLAGGIAHDFNNLLMGIMGNVDIALSSTPETSKTHENLLNIKNVTRRAAEMAGQMLAYAGKGDFEIQVLDLNLVIREITHLLQLSISKKVFLTFKFGEELPSVKADPTQVRQVVMNLITNASEAIGESSGAIRIATRAVDRLPLGVSLDYTDAGSFYDGFVSVEVSDTGCGMDEETVSKVFDPFFTTKFTGRGLGLAAALGIVKQHRGALAIQSRLGHGTSFVVFFPAIDLPAEKSGSIQQGLPEWRGSGTILLVDDEDAVRDAVRTMLSFGGFDVITADEGEEALRKYADHVGEIALVVLDLTMPRMGGDEVLRKLETLDPDVKVLLSSGFGERDVLDRFRERQSVDFIQKPYRLDQLIDKIRLMLEEE